MKTEENKNSMATGAADITEEEEEQELSSNDDNFFSLEDSAPGNPLFLQDKCVGQGFV